MSVLTEMWRGAFQRWVDRRNPVQREVKLNHRRIFILPSRHGAAFLALLLVLLLLAINYQNNLIFVLCFWLFSLLATAQMHSYRNLAGLEIHAGAAEPVFAGQPAVFKLYLQAAGRPRHQVQVGFVEQSEVSVTLDRNDLDYSRECQIHCASQQRGWLVPGRLQLCSYFPLGLLRCWSQPRLDWRCLVYPAPVAHRPLPLYSGPGGSGGQDLRGDSDEFSGFRSYQPGDPPRRIHWKALAKGQGMITRYFEQRDTRELVLDWEQLPGLSAEQRLSTLCAWALQCDTGGLDYALRLPGKTLAKGSGEAHLEAVLTALALAEV